MVQRGLPTRSGRIDVQAAELWLKANRRTNASSVSKTMMVSNNSEPVPASPAVLSDQRLYWQARSRKEQHLEQLRKLELEAKTGELVPLVEIAQTMAALVITAKQNLLGVPERLLRKLQSIIVLDNAQSLEFLAAANALVRAALTRLADSVDEFTTVEDGRSVIHVRIPGVKGKPVVLSIRTEAAPESPAPEQAEQQDQEPEP